MNFADKLRQLLDERNMKAVDLARRTDLSEAIISNYLSGTKEPRMKSLQKISVALGVSVSQLIDFDEAQKLNIPFSEYFPVADESVRGVNYSSNTRTESGSGDGEGTNTKQDTRPRLADFYLKTAADALKHGDLALTPELNELVSIYEKLNEDNKKYLHGYIHRLLEEQENK